MMQMSLRSSLAGFVGIILALAMIQLLGMATALASHIATESAYTRARKVVLLVVAVVALAGLAESLRRAEARGFGELLMNLRDSPIFRVVLAPFQVFTATIFAEDWFPELVGWGAGRWRSTRP